MSQHRRSGRHRPGGSGAVFVDASGQRVRLARRAVHIGIGVCALLLVAVTLSLLGNVPLPGVHPPVTLPGNSHASKHSPTLAREPVVGSSTQPAQATLIVPGGSSSAGVTSSASTSTRATTSSSHGKPSTTPSVVPTSSATSSSRSHGPPI